MPEVRDRYLRIAHYYLEPADKEPAGTRAAKRDGMQASASKRVTGLVRHAGNMPRSNRQCDVLAICQIVF